MHSVEDTLGSIIKYYRLKNELTRGQLAERLNISHRYLISIENEKHKPSYDVLFKIIRELKFQTFNYFVLGFNITD